MGSVFSMPSSSSQSGNCQELRQNNANKRAKISLDEHGENTRLIPVLPDEISFLILARLPRICHLNVRMVSRNWNAAITSRELSRLRKEIGMTEEWLYVMMKFELNKLIWYGVDPMSQKWQRLPPMPYVVNEEESNKRGFSGFRMWNVIGSTIRIADFVKGWFFRRPGLEQMPFCGCSVGAVDGCLYVVGGFSKSAPLNHVWRYDPFLNLWEEVCSMTSARAFCKTALLKDKLYAVGGVSRGPNGLRPLRSAEVFDPETGLWSELPAMPFTKAQILPTAFLADVLKPIATGMAAYQEKLYVSQSLYSWPFFFDIGGEMYDPEINSWTALPDGLGDGWPARQAGTKLAIVVEGELYSLEPSNSLESGQIKRYDHQDDVWKIAVEQVPVHDFTDSEAPYLLASFHGKLNVITKDTRNNLRIMQAVLQNHAEYLPSLSSDSSDQLLHNNLEETGLWRVIAARDFGAAELVSCQVLGV